MRVHADSAIVHLTKCAIVPVGTQPSESSERSDLVLAAEPRRWDVVAQIAEELGRRGSAHPTSAAPSRVTMRTRPESSITDEPRR